MNSTSEQMPNITSKCLHPSMSHCSCVTILDTVLGQKAGHPAYLATVQFDSNIAHLLVFLDFQNEVMDHGIL
jgi:hypothetical protein